MTGPTPMLEPGLASATIRVGLAWLYDTVQPDGVLDQHHGTGRTVADRHYGFVPDQAGCIVSMEITAGQEILDRDHELTNPLEEWEIILLRQMIARYGQEVIGSWNGTGTGTVSLRLGHPAHPSLLAAVDKYRAGCPAHNNSVFCGREEGCTWFEDNHAGLIRPTWPTTADPALETTR